MPPSPTAAAPVASRLARVQRLIARVRPEVSTAAPATPLEQLQETRRQIDTLDHELVRLLAARASLVRLAFAAKQRLGKGVVDADRERSLLAVRRSWARARGLEEAAVTAIFSAVIAFSRGLQGVRP